jgi:hypothetical protein
MFIKNIEELDYINSKELFSNNCIFNCVKYIGNIDYEEIGKHGMFLRENTNFFNGKKMVIFIVGFFNDFKITKINDKLLIIRIDIFNFINYNIKNKFSDEKN